MISDFLPLFRSHLLSWFEARLAEGRSPFRRVEELPPILCQDGLPPDLVLWINRDSLLAGAVILIPEEADSATLWRCAATAAALGLNQFITWEASAVNFWHITDDTVTLHKSWPLPSSRRLTATDFAVTGEHLLEELKMSAITGNCPPTGLPAEYFANLCLLNLQAMQPALDEAARIAARGDEDDGLIGSLARAKGWLTIWRLVALLWYQRLPLGVAPERLEQAIAYAIADLPDRQALWLVAGETEIPLPATAATRCQHLAGRLAQLRWPEHRERALATLNLLLAEACRLHGVDRVAPGEEPADLLINRLPSTADTPRVLLAPRPCLTGLVLLSSLEGSALPATLAAELSQIPDGWRPHRVDARLSETTATPTSTQRRRLLAALRRAWPYRRLSLSRTTPEWLWKALFVAGIAAPEGELRLCLPAGWATAPGADLLWQMLGEQRALSGLDLAIDGRQILTLVAADRAPSTISVQPANNSASPIAFPTTDVPLIRLAGLVPAGFAEEAPRPSTRRNRGSLQEQVENRVFRDGLPRFPEDYLRRRNPVPLCSYQLPGPLVQDSSFFGYCRLIGPAGESLDIDSPVTAEALILAGQSGRRTINLPGDPLVTAELISSYRRDLKQLWETLLRECRRQLSRQQQVRSMARLIWQQRRLPAVDSDR